MTNKNPYLNNYIVIDRIVAISILLSGYLGLAFSHAFRNGIKHWLNYNATDVFALLAGIAASAAGFLISSITILVGFMMETRLKNLTKRHRDDIVEVYFQAIRHWGLTAIMALGLIPVHENGQTWAAPIFLAAVLVSILRTTVCIVTLRNSSKIALA